MLMRDFDRERLIMRKHRNISMKYRWLAFLLCVALCAGSSPMSVLAETGVDGKHVAENIDTLENSVSIDDTDGVGYEDADGTGIGDSSDDDTEDLGNVNDTEGGKDPIGDDGSDNSGEDGTPAPLPDEDTDLDNISDNDLESVSGNNMTSVSENDLDEGRQVLIAEAEEAFDRLLAEKDMMALLYHADSYNARSHADSDSAVAATLSIGQTLYIKGVKITDDDVWYRVQYWLNGAEGSGYVQSYYLAYSDEDWLAWEEEYLVPILGAEEAEYGVSAYGMTTYSMMPYAAVDNSDVAAFPGSYQSALRSLKSAHPNWTFVPMNTGIDFSTAVSGEMAGDRSLIQATSSNKEKGWVGSACPSESGWNYATKSAVIHYMDPRNFLSETYIFQFEQLTFNSSYHNEAAVQSFLNSTFMSGKLGDPGDDRTYAQAFYSIGKSRKLSPIHLASRVYQEQGKGTSGLVSGKYPGYEGYYNFFNVNVYGSSIEEKIKRGLEHAKAQGWNTRYKSLDGGAETIGKNYILKYQDTLYLQKFNVDKNSPYGVYNHQYMQNIQAPASESSSTKKMYAESGSINSAFVFKIPVYNNMPDDEYYPVLTLDKTSLTLSKPYQSENGDQKPVSSTTYQLKIYADGVELQPSNAKWKSSNSAVATVDDNGLVTAVDQGEAVITASFSNVEVVCKVTVKIPLDSISLDKQEVRLRRPDTVVEDTTGLSATEKAENTDTASLQVYFYPGDTTSDRTITWSSSNTKIAKVTADPENSSRAVVTAVGKGDVTITAKASKAGNKTAKCTVHVSAPIIRVALTNPNAKDTDTEQSTTLLAGQSVNLAAEFWPKDTTSDTQVIWSSSNPKVATVKNGRVEAVGEDTKTNKTVITAKMAGCEKGYTATHEIVVENCTVTFMKSSNLGDNTKLKEVTVKYGVSLSEMGQKLPQEETVKDSLFIGWYTGRDGTGSRFDETTVIHQRQTTLYPYYEEQGKGFYALPVGDQVYTGSAIKPVVQVYDSVSYKDGSRDYIELELNKDYTVSYKNNKNVNTGGKAVPTITIKGKGNYSGTETVYFNIVPKALTDTDITADNITVAYNGKVIKSSPTVYRSEKKLSKNTHYTVTYPQTETGAYRTAGTYPIVITGKGGYTGKITVYETITNDILMSKVTIARIPNQTYLNGRINQTIDDGSGKGGIVPEALKVTYRKETLVESTDGGLTGDYTVSFKNNMAIGTATATITAVEGSGYAGSKSVTYKIVGTSIAKAKVEGLENKEYAGSGDEAYQKMLQNPGAYTLTLDGSTLTESTDGGVTGDYVVSYAGAAKEGAAKIGTATIIFKGINEYTGQLKKTYKITGFSINPDESGRNSAITMKYYTQDAPEQFKTITELSEIETPYVKGGSKPGVILYYNGQELKPGKDYTIKYANNNAVTPLDPEERIEKKLPKITVTGKGNFKGSIMGYYTITDGRMSQDNGKLTMTAKDVVYKNKKGAYKSTAVLTDCSGSKLAAGRDYDKKLIYTYENDSLCENPEESSDVNGDDNSGANSNSDNGVIKRKKGEAVHEGDIPLTGTVIRVTAQGIGPYAGSGTANIFATYRITAADISKAKVKVQTKEYRNGHEITLTGDDLQITMSGVADPLKYGEDYTIDADTYTNNINKGKATVVIRGINNYGGEKKITFTISAKKVVWWRNLIGMI